MHVGKSFLIISFSITMALALGGCAPEEKDDFRRVAEAPRKDRLSRMSAEDRKMVAPNSLFTSILEGDLAEVRHRVSAEPALLVQPNDSHQDRPLGLALRLREREIAHFLSEAANLPEISHLLYKNRAGEGYIYLAAAAGYPEIIESLGQRYYRSFGLAAELPSFGIFNTYDFANIDFKTANGRRALFVAADRRVAQTLRDLYHLGIFEEPFFAFQHERDVEGQNYLHQAARDGRADVLAWGVERICGADDPRPSETDLGWVVNGVLDFGRRVYRGFQIQVGDPRWVGNLLVNRQTFQCRDPEPAGENPAHAHDDATPICTRSAETDGRRQPRGLATPLHLAIAAQHLPSVKALTACRYLNFFIPDQDGNIALQTTLLQIPKDRPVTSPEERAVFDHLVNQQTAFYRWTRRADYWNHKNGDGKTSVHIAAEIADPYFYQKLASGDGDINAVDNLGRRARDIFAERQQRLTRHAR